MFRVNYSVDTRLERQVEQAAMAAGDILFV